MKINGIGPVMIIVIGVAVGLFTGGLLRMAGFGIAAVSAGLLALGGTHKR